MLLNPDAVVQPGWAEAIRGAVGRTTGRRGWGSSCSTTGEQINTSGGVLHFTGFGWAGQIGEPVSGGAPRPAEVGFLSGACLAIPRTTGRQRAAFRRSSSCTART